MVNEQLQENFQALWQVMADRYQNRWTSSNGTAWNPQTKPWLLDCRDLTREEFRIGIASDKARFMRLRDENKNPFPPSSLEFRHMAIAGRGKPATETQHDRCEFQYGGNRCPLPGSLSQGPGTPKHCRFHDSGADIELFRDICANPRKYMLGRYVKAKCEPNPRFDDMRYGAAELRKRAAQLRTRS